MIVSRLFAFMMFYMIFWGERLLLIRPAITRVPASSLTSNQALETSGVHSGTLAVALALGIPAERGILFANCAAALAIPTSLSARDAIEAAADELLARDLA